MNSLIQPMTLKVTIALITRSSETAVVETEHGRLEIGLPLLGENPAEGQEVELTNVQLSGHEIIPYQPNQDITLHAWDTTFAGGGI